MKISKSYHLMGDNISKVKRKLGDLKEIFLDLKGFTALSPDKIVYEVESYLPTSEGCEGGLFYGISKIYPGLVGNEYFMTKGHFHLKLNRAEFYFGLKGSGALILMDLNRNTWMEKITPGSVHYIPGCIAHRVANTGKTPLVFGAVWPSDAGHDYESISTEGFSKRLIKKRGKPVLC